jgi:cell division protein FtsB
MTEREQLENLCRWNRELASDNNQLHTELSQLRQERRELSQANANLRVERDATDELLGVAMDEALSAGKP